MDNRTKLADQHLDTSLICQYGKKSSTTLREVCELIRPDIPKCPHCTDVVLYHNSIVFLLTPQGATPLQEAPANCLEFTWEPSPNRLYLSKYMSHVCRTDNYLTLLGGTHSNTKSWLSMLAFVELVFKNLTCLGCAKLPEPINAHFLTQKFKDIPSDVLCDTIFKHAATMKSGLMVQDGVICGLGFGPKEFIAIQEECAKELHRRCPGMYPKSVDEFQKRWGAGEGDLQFANGVYPDRLRTPDYCCWLAMADLFLDYALNYASRDMSYDKVPLSLRTSAAFRIKYALEIGQTPAEEDQLILHTPSREKPQATVANEDIHKFLSKMRSAKMHIEVLATKNTRKISMPQVPFISFSNGKVGHIVARQAPVFIKRPVISFFIEAMNKNVLFSMRIRMDVDSYVGEPKSKHLTDYEEMYDLLGEYAGRGWNYFGNRAGAKDKQYFPQLDDCLKLLAHADGKALYEVIAPMPEEEEGEERMSQTEEELANEELYRQELEEQQRKEDLDYNHAIASYAAEQVPNREQAVHPEREDPKFQNRTIQREQKERDIAREYGRSPSPLYQRKTITNNRSNEEQFDDRQPRRGGRQGARQQDRDQESTLRPPRDRREGNQPNPQQPPPEPPIAFTKLEVRGQATTGPFVFTRTDVQYDSPHALTEPKKNLLKRMNDLAPKITCLNGETYRASVISTGNKNYGHPLSRTVTDSFTYFQLFGVKSKFYDYVIDIGGKQKTETMLGQAYVNYSNYISIRPADKSYDKRYVEVNKNLKQHVGYASAATATTFTNLKGSTFLILAVDCIYYEGVNEFIQAMMLGLPKGSCEVVGVYQNYSPKSCQDSNLVTTGVYEYSEDPAISEGKFTISSDQNGLRLLNEPIDSSGGQYEHKFLTNYDGTYCRKGSPLQPIESRETVILEHYPLLVFNHGNFATIAFKSYLVPNKPLLNTNQLMNNKGIQTIISESTKNAVNAFNNSLSIIQLKNNFPIGISMAEKIKGQFLDTFHRTTALHDEIARQGDISTYCIQNGLIASTLDPCVGEFVTSDPKTFLGTVSQVYSNTGAQQALLWLVVAQVIYFQKFSILGLCSIIFFAKLEHVMNGLKHYVVPLSIKSLGAFATQRVIIQACVVFLLFTSFPCCYGKQTADVLKLSDVADYANMSLQEMGRTITDMADSGLNPCRVILAVPEHAMYDYLIQAFDCKKRSYLSNIPGFNWGFEGWSAFVALFKTDPYAEYRVASNTWYGEALTRTYYVLGYKQVVQKTIIETYFWPGIILSMLNFLYFGKFIGSSTYSSTAMTLGMYYFAQWLLELTIPREIIYTIVFVAAALAGYLARKSWDATVPKIEAARDGLNAAVKASGKKALDVVQKFGKSQKETKPKEAQPNPLDIVRPATQMFGFDDFVQLELEETKKKNTLQFEPGHIFKTEECKEATGKQTNSISKIALDASVMESGKDVVLPATGPVDQQAQVKNAQIALIEEEKPVERDDEQGWKSYLPKFLQSGRFGRTPSYNHRIIGGSQRYGSKSYGKEKPTSADTISRPLVEYCHPHDFSKRPNKPCKFTNGGIKFYLGSGEVCTAVQFLDHLADFQKPNNRRIYNPGLTGYPGYTEPVFVEQNEVSLYHALINRHLAPQHGWTFKMRDRFIKFANNNVAEWCTKLMFRPLNTVSRQQYLDQQPKKNKELYRVGKLRVDHSKWQKVPQLEAMLKKEEACYDKPSEVRARLIFNPPSEYKWWMGFINANLMPQLAQEFKWFCPTRTTEQLTSQIFRDYQKFENPIFISMDGSQHDSRQWDWLIKCVDVQLLERLEERLMTEQVWSQTEKDCFEAYALTTDAHYYALYPGTRQRMFKGRLKGTVFSGSTLRTTLGNTLRVYLLYSYVLSTMSHQCLHRLYVAGDDCLLLLEAKSLDSFMRRMQQCHRVDDEVRHHGTGYVVKSIDIHPTHFFFLSKFGCVSPTGVHMCRKAHRYIRSGNYTTKLSKNLGQAQFNYGITSQLQEQVGGTRLGQSLINHRLNNLPHSEIKREEFLDLIGRPYNVPQYKGDHVLEDYILNYKGALLHFFPSVDIYEDVYKSHEPEMVKIILAPRYGRTPGSEQAPLNNSDILLTNYKSSNNYKPEFKMADRERPRNSNQNQPPQNNKGRNRNQNRNKRQKAMGQAQMSKALDQIRAINAQANKAQFRGYDPTLQNVLARWVNLPREASEYHDQLGQLGVSSLKDKLGIIGMKFLEEMGGVSDANADAALRDGLMASLAQLAAQHGGAALRWIAPQVLEKLKQTRVYQDSVQRAKTFLHDKLGINTNDPSYETLVEAQQAQIAQLPNIPKNEMTTNGLFEDYGLNDDANTVNVQYIIQALDPKRTSDYVRFPNSPEATTLMSFSESFPLSTNVAGHCQFMFQPWRVGVATGANDSSFPILIRNGPSFSPFSAGGAQTADRQISGLFNVFGGTSQVSQYRVLSVVTEFLSTASSLNSQGYVIATSSSNIPNGTLHAATNSAHYVTVADQQQQASYLEYSMKNVNTIMLGCQPYFAKGSLVQNRMNAVSIESHTLEGETIVYSVVGAQPTSSVATIRINYVVELVPEIARQIIGGAMQTGPIGLATLTVVQEAFHQRPGLRYLGKQERMQLITKLSGLGPLGDFKAVRRILAIDHSDPYVTVQSYQGGYQGGSGGGEPLQTKKKDVDEWMARFDSYFPAISSTSTASLVTSLGNQQIPMDLKLMDTYNYLAAFGGFLTSPFANDLKDHWTEDYATLDTLLADEAFSVLGRSLNAYHQYCTVGQVRTRSTDR